jgi:CheY-like chemotaxis protein
MRVAVMNDRYSPAAAGACGAGAGLCPASIRAAAESQHPSAPETSERGTRPRRMPARTVLVIGDDWHMRRFVRAGLERYGYSIKEAENEAAAKSVASAIKPDLVVLDIEAPPVGWADVLEGLRAWLDAPVILLSTHAHEGPIGHLRKTGVAACLVKPIGIAELAARCEAAWRHRDDVLD